MGFRCYCISPHHSVRKSCTSLLNPRAKEHKPEVVAVPEQAPIQKKDGKDVGLTVRIEINLPAVADQETYDRIFKSIRENLLNGE